MLCTRPKQCQRPTKRIAISSPNVCKASFRLFSKRISHILKYLSFSLSPISKGTKGFFGLKVKISLTIFTIILLAQPYFFFQNSIHIVYKIEHSEYLGSTFRKIYFLLILQTINDKWQGLWTAFSKSHTLPPQNKYPSFNLRHF